MTARRRAAAALAATLVVIFTAPASAYLKLGTRTGTRTVDLRWTRFPIRYFVTDRGVSGVGASQFQAAMSRAFATWEGVPDVNLSSEFVGFTSADPFVEDDATVLGFLDRPELERTLGATRFFVNNTTGEILESDIFFNARFAWSVASAGESGRFDLESIAVHEIGHLLGLGHSAIGETEIRPTGGRRVIAAQTVMFPIAYLAGNIEDRTLKADDIAGLSDIYASGGFRQTTGSISGRVTKNGDGVRGAHIVAFNPATGVLVGGFTLTTEGRFVIAGLTPGPYVLRVEPLDDGDVSSFLEDTPTVDLDFQVAFSDQLAVVPRGGSTRQIDIRVVPK